VRVVSWNINSLRKRQDRLFEWLEGTKPDIVCLQETKCTDEQFPALALQATGYDSAYHGEKSYNGVAILSKTKLTNVRASLCDEVVDPQARVISATVRNLRVYSVYVPNGQAVGSPAYNTNSNGTGGCAIAWSKSKMSILLCAVISMSRRKTSMFTIHNFGAARSCVPTASGPHFNNCARSGCAIRYDCITSRRAFLPGGIIGCWLSQKIAVFASTLS
jgi:mRNA deadenylase 3'-5' endonuclease subunit Ccr4